MYAAVAKRLNNGSGPDDGMICGETGSNRMYYLLRGFVWGGTVRVQ